jgi:hypothetical protein
MFLKIKNAIKVLFFEYCIIPKVQLERWEEDLVIMRKKSNQVNNNVYHVLIGRIDSMDSILNKIKKHNKLN